MKYMKRAAIGLLAGVLCATGTVAGVAALSATEARAEVGSVESNSKLSPTFIGLNAQETININKEKQGSYFYFKTDSNKSPYKFEVINGTDSYSRIGIQCYEIGADSDSSPSLIWNSVDKDDTWIKTYNDYFKPNKKYLLFIDEYDVGITNNDFNIRIKISHEGVFKYNDKWTFFNSKGNPDYTYTGVAQTSNGNWVFVKKGVFDTSYTGVAKSTTGNWVFVKKGRYDTSFTGVAKSTTGNWVFVKKGRFDKSYTGVAKSTTGNWVYVIDGRFTKNAQKTVGVALSTTGNSVYVSNGRFTTKYTGLAKSLRTGDLVYVTEGRYDKSFNGKATYEGKTYTVKKGRAV